MDDTEIAEVIKNERIRELEREVEHLISENNAHIAHIESLKDWIEWMREKHGNSTD